MTDHSSPANGVVDVSIGTGSVTVRDHAEVTVSGVTTWAGSVAFSLCKLPLTPTTSNCASGGVAIPFVAPANGNVSNASPNVNSPVTTLTSVGRYCWRATFTRDDAERPECDRPGSRFDEHDQCFEVLPVQPTLTTQASGPAIVNTPISDTATIASLATQPGTNGIVGSTSINATNGAAAGGSITWRALGPNDCTTVAMAATSRAVSGNGTYPEDGRPGQPAHRRLQPVRDRHVYFRRRVHRRRRQQPGHRRVGLPGYDRDGNRHRR